MPESLSARIVHVALSQAGERERAPNVTKYHDWYDAHGTYRYSGQPWCAIFVCWVLDQAGARLPNIQGSEFGAYPGAAAVRYLKSWMEEQGWEVPKGDARPGDAVFFRDVSHVGIVTPCNISDQFSFVSVEGNTHRYRGAPDGAVWVWPVIRWWVEISTICRVPENYSQSR